MEEFKSFAAIVYVTEKEHEAVIRMYHWQELRIIGDEQLYYQSEEKKNGLPIIAARADEMGMTASAALTMKLTMHFKPKYVIMPGIAAGTLKDSVDKADGTYYGDVVLADMVWNYSNGKYVAKENTSIAFGELGFQPRPTVVRIDESLTEYFKKAIQSTKNQTYVHIGPIATGTAVVANQCVVDSIIHGVFTSTKVLEMEAYGVAYAVAHAVEPRPKAIIAKSICDYADVKKSDRFQKFAAYTSCEFVKFMIDDILD